MKSDSKNIENKDTVGSCVLDRDDRYQGIAEMFKALTEKLISPLDILHKKDLIEVDYETINFIKLSKKYNENLCSTYFTTICAIDAPFLKNLSPGELNKLICNQNNYFENLKSMTEPNCKSEKM
jgi:hypothetical protein